MTDLSLPDYCLFSENHNNSFVVLWKRKDLKTGAINERAVTVEKERGFGEAQVSLSFVGRIVNVWVVMIPSF